MCIIAFSPAGQPLPAKERLKLCFQHNSDGAGFMVPVVEKGKVRVRKGFMTWQDFEKALDAMGDLTELPVVLHFRIATQGDVCRDMTHPFPVSDNDKLLSATDSTCDVALAHNGIIDLTHEWGYKSKWDKYAESDTYLFVRDYASLIIRHELDWWKRHESVLLMRRLADSKLAVMGADGHVELIGEFECADDGCYYSNGGYKPTAITVHRYGGLFDDYSSSYVTPAEPRKEHDGEHLYDKGAYPIEGCFVPSDLFIYDPESGVMTSAAEEAVVFDTRGKVYQYTEDWEHLEYVPGLVIVDAELNEYVADRMVACTYYVEANNVLDWG